MNNCQKTKTIVLGGSPSAASCADRRSVSTPKGEHSKAARLLAPQSGSVRLGKPLQSWEGEPVRPSIVVDLPQEETKRKSITCVSPAQGMKSKGPMQLGAQLGRGKARQHGRAATEVT